MKWFLMILPLLIKRLAQIGDVSINPIEGIKEFIAKNAYKVLLAFGSTLTIAILFVAGIVMTVITLANQYDAGLDLKFTANVAGGLGITLVSLIIFAFGIHYASAAERKEKRNIYEKSKSPEPHPLEEVLKLLINDFIQEREFKRACHETCQKEAHDNEKTKETSELFEKH